MKQKTCLALIITLFSISSLVGQTTYELFFVERNALKTQTSATTIGANEFDSPYWFLVGADFSGDVPTAVTAQKASGGEILTLEDYEVGNVEGETDFVSLSGLDAAVPAGDYNIKENGVTVGTVTIGARNLPSANPIKEYDQLQNLDPTQPITLTWDAYPLNGDEQQLEIEISYWDDVNQESVDLYFVNTRGTNQFDLEGLEPSATSAVIPANTFTGSPNGFYNIEVFYAEIYIDAQSDPVKAWVESIDFGVSVQVQTSTGPTTWGIYDVDQGGNVDTMGWIGYINVSNSDLGWIYSFDLYSWIYVRNEDITPQGAWMYISQ